MNVPIGWTPARAARHSLLNDTTVPDPRALVQRLPAQGHRARRHAGADWWSDGDRAAISRGDARGVRRPDRRVSDPNPRVRWWCVQALDHIPSPAPVEIISRALADPVPRVRPNAAHALNCAACKPEWDGTLPEGVEDKLQRLVSEDTNRKVREEARRVPVCTARRYEATSGEEDGAHSQLRVRFPPSTRR
jgi:HEAT repeats